jgi:DNA repair protein RadC
MYIRELAVSYRLRHVPGITSWPPGPLTLPEVAASVFIGLLGHEAVEVCGVLCLSTRLEPIAYHELSRGTLDHAIVMPRDVFRVALLAHAKAVIVGHNHPSGGVNPSPQDVAVTQALVASGLLLGVELLDLIIVSAEGQHYSFKSAGRL